MTPQVSQMFTFVDFTEGKTRGAGHNRKAETREVRLMAAVLRGEAVLHNWDSSREGA